MKKLTIHWPRQWLKRTSLGNEFLAYSVRDFIVAAGFYLLAVILCLFLRHGGGGHKPPLRLLFHVLFQGLPLVFRRQVVDVYGHSSFLRRVRDFYVLPRHWRADQSELCQRAGSVVLLRALDDPATKFFPGASGVFHQVVERDA